MRKGTLTFALLGLGLLTSLSGITWADDDDAYEVVDTDAIYLGTGTHPKAPGVMAADDVWKEIPEYKKILDDDLDEDDPE